MRAVIDTNVLVSGLMWHGAPHALLEHVRNTTLSLVSSPALLAELADVIGRAKFDVMLAEVRQLAEVVVPPPLPRPVCRDPDDDAVLALALAAQADFIVSGDDDLLAIGVFQGIPVLTPAQALQRVPGN